MCAVSDDDEGSVSDNKDEVLPDPTRVIETQPTTYVFDDDQVVVNTSPLSFNVKQVAEMVVKLKEAKSAEEAEMYFDMLGDLSAFANAECPVNAYCDREEFDVCKMEVLSCGHFICSDCLEGVKGSGKTVCPICRSALVVLTST